jgi:hypothetical protein
VWYFFTHFLLLDTGACRDQRLPSLSWLGTGTSIKSVGVDVVLWSQTSHLSEMHICKIISAKFLWCFNFFQNKANNRKYV